MKTITLILILFICSCGSLKDQLALLSSEVDDLEEENILLSTELITISNTIETNKVEVTTNFILITTNITEVITNIIISSNIVVETNYIIETNYSDKTILEYGHLSSADTNEVYFDTNDNKVYVYSPEIVAFVSITHAYYNSLGARWYTQEVVQIDYQSNFFSIPRGYYEQPEFVSNTFIIER
jgi:hypothetical protein